MYSALPIHGLGMEASVVDYQGALDGTNLPGDACLVLTTDPKPRLRWTAELHERFVDAVAQLGGPDSESLFTPMAICMCDVCVCLFKKRNNCCLLCVCGYDYEEDLFSINGTMILGLRRPWFVRFFSFFLFHYVLFCVFGRRRKLGSS